MRVGFRYIEHFEETCLGIVSSNDRKKIYRKIMYNTALRLFTAHNFTPPFAIIQFPFAISTGNSQ